MHGTAPNNSALSDGQRVYPPPSQFPPISATTVRPRAAFTLIELLVVIVIIMVLAALLLPALGRARDTAKRVVCLNTLMHCGKASMLHADNHNQYYPLAGVLWFANASTPVNSASLGDADERRYVYYDDNGVRRPAPLSAALGLYMSDVRLDNRANLDADLASETLRQLFRCAAQSTVPLARTLSGSGGVGTDYNMNATPVERLSYGFNEALLGLYTPTKRQQGLIARVASPDRVMVLADGKPRTEWGDSFMGYYDLRTDRTLYHCWTGASAGPVSMFDFARHGYWMNVLYVDGHAAGLRMTPTEFGEVGVSRGIHEPF